MSSASASTPETIRDDIKVAEPKPVNQTIAQLRSLVAGAAGGVCAVVVGHPFDLVKVRMQTAQKGVYSGAMDVVRKTVAREGLVRGMYAGVSAPLVGVTPMCKLAPIPIVFAVSHSFRYNSSRC
jgi:solute carrier family 25 carnitine/acylcarnitine transporter 20/29